MPSGSVGESSDLSCEFASEFWGLSFAQFASVLHETRLPEYINVMIHAEQTNATLATEPILSVSQLTLFLKELVEAAFPSVWVAGEISNFSRPQSGHCYLTLKDDQAQIKAVIWRTSAGRLRFDPHDGLEVICRGHIDLYPPRGQYQLVIEEIQPRGIGALELALRKLREKLTAEGLFDPARKRPLPAFPRRIAFVTSPTGAAVRDFLQVLERRWHGASVLVIPAKVQGEGAAAEIAAGIATANRLTSTDHAVDVLVVGRGGGSLEDLWAFNEEIVVRAIAASRLPVVSAVGHEIDVTLADLAADVRALTPSEAAERIVPATDEVQAALAVRQQRLGRALRRRAVEARRRLEQFAAHRVFRRPFERVMNLAREVDLLATQLGRAIGLRMSGAKQVLAAVAAQLESLSPLGVLGRGYSLTTRIADGRLIDDAAQLSIGEQIRTRFAHGEAISEVNRIE
jgi:exodeoxyribonuclease VII large subunit